MKKMKKVPGRQLQDLEPVIEALIRESAIPEILSAHVLFLVANHNNEVWAQFSDPHRHLQQLACSLALACGCGNAKMHVEEAMLPAALGVTVWRLMQTRPQWLNELRELGAGARDAFWNASTDPVAGQEAN